MTRTWFVAGALALAVGIAVPTTSKASPASPQAYRQQGDGQQRGWDAPPQRYNEVERRGFHDGIEGAQKDYGNGRRPDVNNREEYRNANQLPGDIPPRLRGAYREAFRNGYAAAASHLWGNRRAAPAYQPPQPPPPPSWESWGMRGLQSDAQHQGYREGVEEARKDYQWHRRADPDDREEYRNPRVAPQFVDEYREGFMRGYTVAMSQLSGDPDWQQYRGDPGQWQAPRGYSDMQRRGFRDGIEGARRDFGNHRRPDPNNRDEYRDPQVPGQFRQDYRLGFRRGYEMAASRLYGGM